jgi:hypothetical protein
VYLDSAYIAKCYVNEPDSPAVDKLAMGAARLYSSVLAVAEVHCVFHRQVRGGTLKPKAARELARTFLEDVDEGVWELIPASEQPLRRTAAIVIASRRDSFCALRMQFT